MPSIESVHVAKVAKLKKSPLLILDTLTPEKVDVLHMGLGIFTEAGEIATTVKAYVMYNKPLDRENLIEELGDLEFYLEGLRQIIDVTREEILDHNNKKLLTGEKARYKDGYTDEAAIARVDKQE